MSNPKGINPAAKASAVIERLRARLEIFDLCTSKEIAESFLCEHSAGFDEMLASHDLYQDRYTRTEAYAVIRCLIDNDLIA